MITKTFHIHCILDQTHFGKRCGVVLTMILIVKSQAPWNGMAQHMMKLLWYHIGVGRKYDITLVRCPKWLFDNSIFWSSSAKQSKSSQSEFSLAYQNQKKIVQNTPARFISTRKYIQSEFCLAYQNQKKSFKVRRPDLFPRACILERNFSGGFY